MTHPMVQLSRSTATVRCGRCGHGIPVDAWKELPALRTLTPEDLAPHVQAWHGSAGVVVRACPSCATPLARRSPAQ